MHPLKMQSRIAQYSFIKHRTAETSRRPSWTKAQNDENTVLQLAGPFLCVWSLWKMEHSSEFQCQSNNIHDFWIIYNLHVKVSRIIFFFSHKSWIFIEKPQTFVFKRRRRLLKTIPAHKRALFKGRQWKETVKNPLLCCWQSDSYLITKCRSLYY